MIREIKTSDLNPLIQSLSSKFEKFLEASRLYIFNPSLPLKIDTHDDFSLLSLSINTDYSTQRSSSFLL